MNRMDKEEHRPSKDELWESINRLKIKPIIGKRGKPFKTYYYGNGWNAALEKLCKQQCCQNITAWCRCNAEAILKSPNAD